MMEPQHSLLLHQQPQHDSDVSDDDDVDESKLPNDADEICY